MTCQPDRGFPIRTSSSAVQSSPWIARLLSWPPFPLLLLCLLAFSLRVFRLDFQPIWFDEDLAYQRATAELDVSLASMAGSPLYYVILRGWADLAGSSLYALRFFSALCGTLAVPLIYQVARRLLGREAALARHPALAVAGRVRPGESHLLVHPLCRRADHPRARHDLIAAGGAAIKACDRGTGGKEAGYCEFCPRRFRHAAWRESNCLKWASLKMTQNRPAEKSRALPGNILTKF
jgi:hypothetical protein